MTTYSTEMNVFRSQVRYPITPADPLDDVDEKNMWCVLGKYVLGLSEYALHKSTNNANSKFHPEGYRNPEPSLCRLHEATQLEPPRFHHINFNFFEVPTWSMLTPHIQYMWSIISKIWIYFFYAVRQRVTVSPMQCSIVCKYTFAWWIRWRILGRHYICLVIAAMTWLIHCHVKWWVKTFLT